LFLHADTRLPTAAEHAILDGLERSGLSWGRFDVGIEGRNPLLDTLDCPDPSALTPRRAVTTTPLQALGLRNNDFVLRMSEHWAQRIEREAGRDAAAQVGRAYELALGRAAAASEVRAAQTLVQRHGLRALCRALLNCNEFIYVD